MTATEIVILLLFPYLLLGDAILVVTGRRP